MSGRTVAIEALVGHLPQVSEEGGSGMFNIVTDAQRSVLLRVSDGRITSSRCRGRDIDKAIAVLESAAAVRYSYVPGDPESGPELIPMDEFLARNEPDLGPVPDTAMPTTPSRAGAGTMRDALEELAVEVIGPVAPMVVDDAVSRHATVQGAIRAIARAIPDEEASRQFLEAARERIPDIENDI